MAIETAVTENQVQLSIADVRSHLSASGVDNTVLDVLSEADMRKMYEDSMSKESKGSGGSDAASYERNDPKFLCHEVIVLNIVPLGRGYLCQFKDPKTGQRFMAKDGKVTLIPRGATTKQVKELGDNDQEITREKVYNTAGDEIGQVFTANVLSGTKAGTPIGLLAAHRELVNQGMIEAGQCGIFDLVYQTRLDIGHAWVDENIDGVRTGKVLRKNTDINGNEIRPNAMTTYWFKAIRKA